MNILDLLKEPPPMMQPVEAKPPVPTEKAQIVIMFEHSASTVVRFRSAKKAYEQYRKLQKARAGFHIGAAKVPFIELDGDMFVTEVDVSKMLCASFIEFAQYDKFTPR